MSVGWAGYPAPRSRSRPGSGATCSNGWGSRSPSASRGRSSSPRSRAAWRSPTVCSWCRPTPSSSSSIRSRCSGCGASARSRRRSCSSGGSRRSPTSPGSTSRCWSRCSAAASGRHLHALAHNRDPRPVVVGRRRGSIGSQHALGRSGVRKDPACHRRVARRARRPRHAADARRARGSGARSCSGCVSTTSHARPARTRSRTPPRTPARSSRPRASSSPAAMPKIERDGCTLVGVAVGNLADDRVVQLALPFTKGSGGRSTPRSTTCATGSAPRP